MPDPVVRLVYLLAAALFILGLRGLSHPRTAVRGNLMAAFGMLLAVVVTLLDRSIVGYEVIIAGLAVGALAGTLLATRVPFTAMPQMVGLLNGFGGGASGLVAAAALREAVESGGVLGYQLTIAVAASGVIGAVTFWGSMVAFAKLQGLVTEKPVLLPGRNVLNAAVAAGSLGVAAWVVADPGQALPLWALLAVASLLGVLLVIPIGGADMPVVISLLNSYSGLAAAATGFVLGNDMLIIAGSLVGAAGFILTTLMCRAMNRSLANVLFGGVGAVAQAGGRAGDEVYAGRVKSATAVEVAMLLQGARRVVFVPGFGLAAAQAQFAIRDLANLLVAEGTEVEFAIHPVAGRMPGHMNVLLAEANVPYEMLKEMDEVNPSFPQTDVAIVVGANDVVNPVARDTDPSNPIAGMPILNVDQARTVVVVKRSLSPGFAGIPNPLFAADNTLMLFADARKAAQDLIAAFKEA